MSELIREVVATVLFIIACIALYIIFTDDFNLLFCALVPICFLSAYFIWPKQKNREKGMTALDMIEAVILFPVECIIWISRLLYRFLGFIAGGKEGGGFD
ncbi:hypothetical protein [Pseudoalteromonas luteoviolacea]|uniref:Uncharacterized protein n=1 Tax=Pseudoalteromonas luteoviolacea S4054 TaxID=1129367 RepID=A0A0F6AFI6_9GAMM|nr:hypothetical protein [Pseudoalteromonas luteoviolacea]AOT09311.1 hypothetical protein S4054249_16300 [Pseudoalteromonas luteoviolacea]AOT14223.1 hypothetical protein S40542_16270 [Pseudoalteromonas luteoviolacea]AOT19139.1 hypothetical protein S4054_16275 [Pseudoalteromonas luteoviolacea]KKE84970.1 hypothetical protein N479_05940 [Pseudoalteromonas luteoviolacea S4054]KZN70088.1 hypothetical protein N481_01050 [Pseudoalteromonas luteoviolacea S4047-1]